MSKRLWRQILIVVICTLASGVIVARGLPPLGVMAMIALVGACAIVVLAVLAPLPDAGRPASASGTLPLPSGIGRHLLEGIPSPLFLIDQRAV